MKKTLGQQHLKQNRRKIHKLVPNGPRRELGQSGPSPRPNPPEIAKYKPHPRTTCRYLTGLRLNGTTTHAKQNLLQGCAAGRTRHNVKRLQNNNTRLQTTFKQCQAPTTTAIRQHQAPNNSSQIRHWQSAKQYRLRERAESWKTCAAESFSF